MQNNFFDFFANATVSSRVRTDASAMLRGCTPRDGSGTNYPTNSICFQKRVPLGATQPKNLLIEKNLKLHFFLVKIGKIYNFGLFLWTTNV